MTDKPIKKIAAIDIGSNSIRLVIFDELKRIPLPIFSDKVSCELAKNLEETGVLNPEGVQVAQKTLARYMNIISNSDISSLFVLATAAMRDAADGNKFLSSFETLHQVHTSLISGEEEAELAAYGIISSFDQANGVVADLGGGSLELAYVEDKKVFLPKSFPLGFLRLLSKSKKNNNIVEVIDNEISYISKIPNFRNKKLYAIGGSFRELAKLYCALGDYPLKIIHNLEISKEDFSKFIEKMKVIKPADLERISNINQKRIGTTPYVLNLAERLIHHVDPESIIFSACGIREGFLYTQITDEEKQIPALIASSQDLAKQFNLDINYGTALYEWLSPIIEMHNPEFKLITKAACLLSEISRFEHTEYRAEIAYRAIVDSFITGLSHKMRVFLAKCLFHRYKANEDPAVTTLANTFLNQKENKITKRIGTAIRLAYTLSAGSINILKDCKLEITEDNIYLKLSNASKDLYGPSVEKNFIRLAALLKKEPVVSG